MIIPITTRKIKSVKVSLFVYPPKYGYFELSVFDYELLCLNGARSWTSLQFVQVRTPTSHPLCLVSDGTTTEGWQGAL